MAKVSMRPRLAIPWVSAHVLLAIVMGCGAVTPVDAPLDPPRSGPALALPYSLAVRVEPSDMDVGQEDILAAIREAGTFGAGEGTGAPPDIDLAVQVAQPRYEFVCLNERHRLAFWLWIYAWAPSLWVRDETYSGEVEWTASLVSLRTGREVARVEGESRVEGDLNDFERGFVWLGPIRVPDALGEENFREVGGHLGPLLSRRIPGDLARGLDEAVRKKAGSPGFVHEVTGEGEAAPVEEVAPARPAQRVCAVVVASNGAWSGDEPPRARYAEADAEAVRDWLVLPDGPGCAGRDVYWEVGPSSSAKRVRDYLTDRLPVVSAHADALVVFLAGTGAIGPVGGGGHARYILLGDGDSMDVTRTGLLLDSVFDALARVATPRVLVVVDAGFGGGGRSTPWRPTTTDVDEPGLARFAARPGRAALLAAAPGKNASEPAALGHGLLTQAVLDGLQGAADADGDGQVSAGELSAFAGTRVQSASRGMQQPIFIGDAAVSLQPVVAKGGQ